jgi:hypothetical protein
VLASPNPRHLQSSAPGPLHLQSQQSSISLSSFVASDSGLDSSSTNYYPMMTPNPPGPSTIPSPSQEPCNDHSCKVPLLHSATYLQLVRIGLQLALAGGVTYRPIMVFQACGSTSPYQCPAGAHVALSVPVQTHCLISAARQWAHPCSAAGETEAQDSP